MNCMYKIWPGDLSESWVDTVNEIAKKYPAIEASIGFDGKDVVEQVRRSEVRWLNPQLAELKYIKETLMNFAEDANRNYWGFDINYLKDIQHTTYKSDVSGKYDWHEDVFWINPTTFHRKISVVIQLTDPKEYDGGDFQIDPQYGVLNAEEIRKKGTVIAFPSFLKHRVTPVTRGIRNSLVCWVEGPKFK